MRFCPLEKCEHYSTATKYPRKCYYGDPQCWKGWWDLILKVFWLGTIGRFRLSKKEEVPMGQDSLKIKP